MGLESFTGKQRPKKVNEVIVAGDTEKHLAMSRKGGKAAAKKRLLRKQEDGIWEDLEAEGLIKTEHQARDEEANLDIAPLDSEN